METIIAPIASSQISFGKTEAVIITIATGKELIASDL